MYVSKVMKLLEFIFEQPSYGLDHIMYFLVNAHPPKRLDVTTTTLQVHRSHDVEGTGQQFV